MPKVEKLKEVRREYRIPAELEKEVGAVIKRYLKRKRREIRDRNKKTK